MSTYYQSEIEQQFCKLSIEDETTRSTTALPSLRLRRGVQTREPTAENESQSSTLSTVTALKDLRDKFLKVQSSADPSLKLSPDPWEGFMGDTKPPSIFNKDRFNGMDLNLLRKSPARLSLRLKHYDISFSVKHIFPIQDISTIAGHLNQKLPNGMPPQLLNSSTEPMIVWHRIYDPEYQRQLEYLGSKIVIKCTSVKKEKGKGFVVEPKKWTRSICERVECHPKYAAGEKMALGNLNVTKV